MKKALLIILLLSSSGLSAQWNTVTPPAGTGNVYSVFAITDNAVAIAGDARVSRTIDGGLNWTTPLTITGAFIYEVHSPEPTHWYSLTRNSTWFIKVGNPSGLTAYSGKPDSILSLHFNTPSCGVAVGIGGKIEVTCDTGTTWQLRSSNTTASLNAVWFADASTGCACGSFGKITRTTDGGLTWDTVSSTVTQQLNGINFPTSTVGYIVGNAGTFLKSTDAGATWNAMPTGVTNHLNGVYFQDVDTGYIAGTTGLIMKTTDGGSSWTPMTTPTTQTLNSIHFASTNVGWAVGNGAIILKFNANATCSVTANVLSNISCFGGNNGSAYASPSGATPPYTYLWTPSSQTGQTATNLSAGTYTVAVTDSAGCNTWTTVTITQPPALTAVTSIMANVNCFNGSNGSARVVVAGGTPSYTYIWLPSGGNGATASNLTAGTYTVMVTDANGCSATATTSITQPTALTAGASTVSNVLCNGGNSGCVTVTPSGGTPGYTYTWIPSGGNLATACNLSAGTYTVIVTDANGCTVTASATVTEPTALTSSIINSQDVSCFGGNNGSATVSVTGGTPAYTYSWIPSGGNSAAANNLTAGNYIVVVTDANNCTTSSTVTITEPPLLVLTDSVTDASCSSCCDGSMVPTITGGTPPYSYTMTCGPVFNLCPGTYVCCVMDANGCSACDTVVISYPSSIAEISQSGIQIYPNPASGQFSIEFSEQIQIRNGELKIFDATGREVYSDQVINRNLYIVNQNYSPGIYFIKLRDGENMIIGKVLIE
jgi:hypothetical protein